MAQSRTGAIIAIVVASACTPTPGTEKRDAQIDDAPIDSADASTILPCKTASDCEPHRPYCKDASVCVACLTDDDCGSSFGGPRCRIGKTSAEPNRCVACLDNYDCRGESADPSEPNCFEDGTTTLCVECLSDKDCVVDPKRTRCDLEIHACNECATAADCKDPKKPLCDPTFGVCAECLTNADCKDASKPVCKSPTCVAS